jgi:hypothetical protein
MLNQDQVCIVTGGGKGIGKGNAANRPNPVPGLPVPSVTVIPWGCLEPERSVNEQQSKGPSRSRTSTSR